MDVVFPKGQGTSDLKGLRMDFVLPSCNFNKMSHHSYSL